jgi:glucokinase
MAEMKREHRWILGLDIGGTNTALGLVPMEGGEPLGFRKIRTRPEGGGEDVMARIVTAAREVLDQVLSSTGAPREDVAGVGIGAPGPLNRESGILLEAPNLGWRDFPVRALIADGLDLPAHLDNDANCATYGEWWMGAGRGTQTLVGLTLGTGIGGGLVINGEIHHGASDVAGEFGHTTIASTGRKCKCGNYGCLEAYASGPNIAARALEGIVSGAESILPELVDGRLEELTAATVYEGVVLGDPYAEEVMKETAMFLGVGVANLINALNPDAVVIAGGVTRAGEHLFIPLMKEVRRRAFRSAVDACRVVPAELPETAGVVGAAAIFKKASLGSL